MPAAMLFAGLVKRRSILRVFLAAASVLILVGSLAFSAAVAVLGASAVDTTSVCSQSGAAGQPAASGSDALRIGAGSRAPVSVTARQRAVAVDYVSIGQQLGVPREGQIIAIMMALQESSLRVLANVNVPASLQYPHDGLGSDHDSLGTAQQRPAAGWGSVEQLMDPKYNVRAFYGGPAGPNRGSPPGLLDIRGWQSMNKGQAAQAVQVSAFPELYARWEAEATAIVDALDRGIAPAVCEGTTNSSSVTVAPTNLSEIRKDILRFTQEGVGVLTCGAGPRSKRGTVPDTSNGSIGRPESICREWSNGRSVRGRRIRSRGTWWCRTRRGLITGDTLESMPVRA